MANEWDDLADEWDDNRQTPSSTLGLFTEYARGTVLDAGCGNARNSLELAKTAGHVIALDASDAMLEKARRNAEGNPKVDVQKGRLQQMPLEDEHVDAVFCLAAFHHLKPADQGKGATEFFRVLRKGGRLCLTVWNRRQARFCSKAKELDVPWKGKPRYYYFFDEDELKALLESAGFRVQRAIYEKDGRHAAPQEAQNLCIIAQKTE